MPSRRPIVLGAAAALALTVGAASYVVVKPARRRAPRLRPTTSCPSRRCPRVSPRATTTTSACPCSTPTPRARSTSPTPGRPRRRRRRRALPRPVADRPGRPRARRRHARQARRPQQPPRPSSRAAVLGQAAQAWMMADAPDRAFASATRALALTQDDADLLIDRAIAGLSLERYREAADDLSHALDTRPDPGRCAGPARLGLAPARQARPGAGRYRPRLRPGPREPGRLARARHPAPARRRLGRRARTIGSARSRWRPTAPPAISPSRTWPCWRPGPTGAKNSLDRHARSSHLTDRILNPAAIPL